MPRAIRDWAVPIAVSATLIVCVAECLPDIVHLIVDPVASVTGHYRLRNPGSTPTTNEAK
jgi:hypothetical protein